MLSSLATERKPIRCSIFSSGSLDRNILVRDSFSNDRLDPLVTAGTQDLKNYRKTLRGSIISVPGGGHSQTPARRPIERYAGEPNLPAKKLVSGSSKIVELRRLGAILSF